MKYTLLICCILFAGYLSAQTVEPVLSQVESVNPFSALRVDKGLRVFVTTGNEQSITTSGNPNAIRVVCNGRRLKIKKALFAPETDVYITCTDLRKIRAEYGAYIICTNIHGEQLEILMDEHARVQFSGDVDQLRVVNKNGALQLSNNYQLDQQLYDYKGNYTDIYVSDDTAQLPVASEQE